jgi:ubiquitin-protein ligase E3 C
LSKVLIGSPAENSVRRHLYAAIGRPLAHDLETQVAGRLSSTRAMRKQELSSVPTLHSDTETLRIYQSFASQFLTTPRLEELLLGLQDLSNSLHLQYLCLALTKLNYVDLGIESRLWLLAHFIGLHNLQPRGSFEPYYLQALSILLSDSASDIVNRIGLDHPMDDGEDEEMTGGQSQLSLPKYVEEQITSLVNKESITSLLSRYFFAGDKGTVSTSLDNDAQLLASYALTLLRIFPQRGDEIRMWLFLGSASSSKDEAQIPALKIFWQIMRATRTFVAIAADSKAALNVLKRPALISTYTAGSSPPTGDQDWRSILLFLELYTFVLRFTDDEEFLSGGRDAVLASSVTPASRFKESALPLEDVKLLTNFLKNLAFTMYFYAAELEEEDQFASHGSISGYFGGNSAISGSLFPTATQEREKKQRSADAFVGIAGMTMTYVRGIVASVMRMLYERDSRRPFLPKDHWLMTSHFDMGNFIPAVVTEEERQHEVGEDVEEEEEEEEDGDFVTSRSDLVGTAVFRRATNIERIRKQQEKAARKRVLAVVGPRLEILQHMPFVIPFETRVQIFRQFVYRDQTRRRGGFVDPDMWRMSIIQGARQNHLAADPREQLGRHHAKIRREHIFDDALEQFYVLGEGLKEPIQITFVDQFDTVEAGIDGGGVTKEFLTSITNEAFKSSKGSLGDNLFETNDQNLLYPNPSMIDQRKDLLREALVPEGSTMWNETIRDLLHRYEFLGRVVGKCMYEGILIDINFAAFFLLKWATTSQGSDTGYKPNINDLRDLDESLYQGLLQLKNYPGDVEDFSLDFTITDVVSSNKTITRPLIPNGASIPVTNENRPLYVSYVVRHRLLMQPMQQTQAFLRGLHAIIKPSWLSMFNQSELQRLVGGDSSAVDIEDLRANTQYGGVYVIGDDGLEHPSVQLFWEVMQEFDDDDRRKVLKYVTSTPRAPLLGFGVLNPRFSIRDGGADESRLPSTSTCVNLLKLPRYSSKGVLRDKLLYAVNSGAGFDLS